MTPCPLFTQFFADIVACKSHHESTTAVQRAEGLMEASAELEILRYAA